MLAIKITRRLTPPVARYSLRPEYVRTLACSCMSWRSHHNRAGQPLPLLLLLLGGHDRWFGDCSLKTAFSELFEICQQQDATLAQVLVGGELQLSFRRCVDVRTMDKWGDLTNLLRQGRKWRSMRCVLDLLGATVRQWKILCSEAQGALLLRCLRLLDRRRGELLRIAWRH